MGGNKGGGSQGREKRSRPRSRSSSERGAAKMPKPSDEEFKVIIKFKNGSDKPPNPLKLSALIRDKIGDILHAKVLSNGNILIICRSKAQRDKALLVKHLGDRAVETFIPGFNQDGVQGVIYGVDTDISEDDLFRNLKGAEVRGVRRFKTMRDGERKDSTAVLVTFKEDVLPQRVSLGFIIYPVKPYERPPLRCFKCQRFGHIAAVCRGVRRCGKCGGQHDRAECLSTELKCCNCGGNHMAGFRSCVHAVRAQHVETIRSTENVSYAEAVKRVSDGSGPEVTCPLGAGQSSAQNVIIPENSFIVDQTAFLAFLVEILWVSKQINTTSEMKAMIAKEAGRYFGLTVAPEALNLSSARSAQRGRIEMSGASSVT